MWTQRTVLYTVNVKWMFILALSSLSTVSCKTVAISSGFEKQILREGDDITLQCRATGLYHVTVTWLLDGLPLEYTSTEPSVSVRITADNPHAKPGFLNSKQSRYSINILNERLDGEKPSRGDVMAEEIDNSTKGAADDRKRNLTAQIFDPSSSRPKLFDEPAPLVSPNIELTENVVVSVTSVLTLVNATVRDGGIYACVARDVMRDSVEWRRKVAVAGPLSLRQNKPILALVDSVVVIPCTVLGTGDDPPIKWFHQKFAGSKWSSLPNDRRQTVHNNGSLEIREARKANQGVYMCQADLKGRLANMSTSLRVMAPPKIKPFVLPEVQVGKPVAEFCVVSEGDIPLDISWYKDGTVLRPNGFTEMHRSGKRALSFTISSVDPSSAGNYSCCAENNVSRTCRKSELLVLDPPEILDLPLEVSAVAGNDVFIPCRATGFPRPSVTWMRVVDDSLQLYAAIPQKKGDKRKGLQHPKPVQTADGALLVVNASSEHGGKYLCRAVNKVDELSRYVTLHVHNAARIVELNGTQDVVYRNDVTIECASWGDGVVDVTWRKDGRVLPFLGRHIGSAILDYRLIEIRYPVTLNRLLIKDATRSDTGKYSCQATNKFGQSHQTINVVVRAPPSKPNGFEVIDKGTSFLRMVVKSGEDDGGSKLLEYELNFTKTTDEPSSLPPNDRVQLSPLGKRQNATGTVMYPVSATSSDQEIVLDRLECGTEYRMSIRGANELGGSFEALELTARTIGTDPIIPAENELVVDVNQTAVVLDLRAWQNGGCPITDMTIEFARHGDTEWNVTAVDTSVLQTELSRLESGENRGRLVISSLQPGTWYKIWSSACNNAGCNYVTHSVPTLLPSGGTVPPLKKEAERKGTETTDARFLVPMVCGFGLVFMLALILLLYRYKQRSKKQTRLKEARKMANKLLCKTEDSSSTPSAGTEAGLQEQIDGVNAALVETSTSSAGDDDATFPIDDRGLRNTVAARFFDDVSAHENTDTLTDLPTEQNTVLRALPKDCGSTVTGSDGGVSRRSEGKISLKDNAELAVFRDADSSDDECQAAADEPSVCDESAFGDSGTWCYVRGGSEARRPRLHPIAAKNVPSPKRLSSSSSGTDEELAELFGLPCSKQGFKPVLQKDRFVTKSKGSDENCRRELLANLPDANRFQRSMASEGRSVVSKLGPKRASSAGVVSKTSLTRQFNPIQGDAVHQNRHPNRFSTLQRHCMAKPESKPIKASLPPPQCFGVNFQRANGQPKGHTYSHRREMQQRLRSDSTLSGANQFTNVANASPYGERQWVDTCGSQNGTAHSKPGSWASTDLDPGSQSKQRGDESPSIKGGRKMDADSPRDSGIGSDEGHVARNSSSSVSPPYAKGGNVRKSPESLEEDGGRPGDSVSSCGSGAGDKDSVFPPSPSPFTSKKKRTQHSIFGDTSSNFNTTSVRSPCSPYLPRERTPASRLCHSGPLKKTDRFVPTPPRSRRGDEGWREAELDGLTNYHRNIDRRLTAVEGKPAPKSAKSSDRETTYSMTEGERGWQASTLV